MFKTKIRDFHKRFLCNLGFLNYSIGEAILFKEKPEKNIIDNLKKIKWNYKHLPNNPIFVDK